MSWKGISLSSSEDWVSSDELSSISSFVTESIVKLGIASVAHPFKKEYIGLTIIIFDGVSVSINSVEEENGIFSEEVVLGISGWGKWSVFPFFLTGLEDGLGGLKDPNPLNPGGICKDPRGRDEEDHVENNDWFGYGLYKKPKGSEKDE